MCSEVMHGKRTAFTLCVINAVFLPRNGESDSPFRGTQADGG